MSRKQTKQNKQTKRTDMKTLKNTIRTTATAALFSMASLLSFSQQDSKVWLTIENSNNVPTENERLGKSCF